MASISLVAVLQIPEMSSQDQEALLEACKRSGEESHFTRGSEDTPLPKGYGQSSRLRGQRLYAERGAEEGRIHQAMAKSVWKQVKDAFSGCARDG